MLTLKIKIKKDTLYSNEQNKVLFENYKMQLIKKKYAK